MNEGNAAKLQQKEKAPTPDKGENLEVILRRVDNGFIVKVGCKIFVFESFPDLQDALNLYYEDPQAAREKYCRK